MNAKTANAIATLKSLNRVRADTQALLADALEQIGYHARKGEYHFKFFCYTPSDSHKQEVLLKFYEKIRSLGYSIDLYEGDSIFISWEKVE